MRSETSLQYQLPNHMLCVRIFAQFSNIEDVSSCEARWSLSLEKLDLTGNKNAITSKVRVSKQIYIEHFELLGHNHGSTLVFFQTFIYII